MRPLFATTFTLATVAGLSTIPSFAAQGDVVWFRFKKSFIQSSYPTAIAFGTIDAGSEW